MKPLLLLLSHYPSDPLKRDQMADLLKEVQDWNKATHLINSHGIIALAAYNVKEAQLENLVPTEYMAILENGLQRNIIRNAWLNERWKEVNSILTEAGIKHILLKGMALEHTLYGGHGLRQMTDNDILIHPDQAMQAWKTLKDHGFQTRTLKSSLHKKIMLVANKHLPTLLKDGYAVEIHTRLLGNSQEEPDPTEIFRNAPEIFFDGVQAFVLPEDINLQYLTDHFSRHLDEGEGQIRAYADILLLDKSLKIEFPEAFVEEPSVGNLPSYQKVAYRSAVRSVPERYRLRFVIGDIFPSLRWMKQRYGCGVAGALLRYPMRVGKLGWLV
jgi:hypothetical protein